uniref:NADH dehydrogenase subunit 6 n=1 Tax=Sophonia microstaina TaxID=3092775 RepID=A0AAF0YZE8_9HEMI|nr:NADH dehydrogenase subunit 6 [Sophonia microstaina]WPC85244.1 NADH dehydrogenase subunit 6 [Sophonia microstaina]
MKMLIMKMMILVSSYTPFLKNPMSMGIMLIFQTFLMILMMNKIMLSSWFVMITFLMMIGGVLILFTYMSSIASNEMFKFNVKLLIVFCLFMMITDEMMNDKQLMEIEDLLKTNQNENISMIKLYNNKSMLITILMVLYLLLTMIVVSMIVKHNQGPLRSKSYE